MRPKSTTAIKTPASLSTVRFRSNQKRLALVASLLLLSACGSHRAWMDADDEGKYMQEIGGAPVIARATPYSDALACVGEYIQTSNVRRARIAVGRIYDYTGKQEVEGGPKVTQGASLMAMSALDRAGAMLVERFDTTISELELKYANNKLISDGPDSYRRILAGSVPGSDFFLVGGITELNYNIRSTGIDGYAGGESSTSFKTIFNGKVYVMDIALDLRLVDTQTLAVIDVVSYQKQIIGREVTAGVFDFFGGTLVDIGVGERSLEPIQLAVRTVVERAVLEIMAGLYRIGPDICAEPAPGSELSIIESAFKRANDRMDPNRWHNRRDGAVRAAAEAMQLARITGIKLDHLGDRVRAVVELDGPISFRVLPGQGAVELRGVKVDPQAQPLGPGLSPLRRVEVINSKRGSNRAEIKFDTAAAISLSPTLLTPDSGGSHRLQIDLLPASGVSSGIGGDDK